MVAERNVTALHNLESVTQAAAALNRSLFEWPHDTADVFSGSEQRWFRLVALPRMGVTLAMLEELANDPAITDATTTAEFSEGVTNPPRDSGPEPLLRCWGLDDRLTVGFLH